MTASPAHEMDPATGFRDDWRWTRSFSIAGTLFSLGMAAWHSLNPTALDPNHTRMTQWLGMAGIFAGLYIGRATADGWNRRQSVVAYETTKLQISAQRRADFDGAAG